MTIVKQELKRGRFHSIQIEWQGDSIDSIDGMAWEARANLKKPWLSGFCWMSRGVGTTITTYNPAGPAGWTYCDQADTLVMMRLQKTSLRGRV